MSRIRIAKSRQYDFEEIEDFTGCIAKIILKADKHQVYNVFTEELDKDRLYWLVFYSADGCFSIACAENEINFLNLKKLQNFISHSFKTDFKICSDKFCPEQFNAFYAHQLRSENSGRMLIVYSKSLPAFENPICRNTEFVVSPYLYRLTGDRAGSLSDSFIFCLAANRYVIERIDKKSVFELKEVTVMEDDMQLNAAVKIGMLQITVADFMKLKVGSQIEFDMPPDIAVEIEVENSLFAKGKLSSDSEGRGHLRIEEITG